MRLGAILVDISVEARGAVLYVVDDGGDCIRWMTSHLVKAVTLSLYGVLILFLILADRPQWMMLMEATVTSNVVVVPACFSVGNWRDIINDLHHNQSHSSFFSFQRVIC